MLENKDRKQLQQLLERVEKNTRNFLGYPVSKDFDYSDLAPFLKYPLNNLGDPFVESTYAVGTRELEKEVIAFFAKLFRAKEDDWWGYVTNGGSEGNLYGLYLARELYPKGMVYYSESTHYSVQKNIHLLNIPSIVIRSQENGEMDYQDLRNTINMNRQVPVIVLANIGTTMKEARDDVGKVKDIFRELAVHNHYIHADGALSGTYSAFLDPRPSFDFADGADSIAISGHKFIGAPVPSGVAMAKKSHRDRIAHAVSYIGTLDTTITGSRNGLSPLFLWYAIKTLGVEGLTKRTHHSLEVAAYCEEKLKNLGLNAWRNPNAITVVFPEPPAAIKHKWQLACQDGMSHIICMPNVSKSQIDEFTDELELALKSDQH